jgi:hypothetical protein
MGRARRAGQSGDLVDRGGLRDVFRGRRQDATPM